MEASNRMRDVRSTTRCLEDAISFGCSVFDVFNSKNRFSRIRQKLIQPMRHRHSRILSSLTQIEGQRPAQFGF